MINIIFTSYYGTESLSGDFWAALLPAVKSLVQLSAVQPTVKLFATHCCLKLGNILVWAAAPQPDSILLLSEQGKGSRTIRLRFSGGNMKMELEWNYAMPRDGLVQHLGRTLRGNGCFQSVLSCNCMICKNLKRRWDKTIFHQINLVL